MRQKLARSLLLAVVIFIVPLVLFVGSVIGGPFCRVQISNTEYLLALRERRLQIYRKAHAPGEISPQNTAAAQDLVQRLRNTDFDWDAGFLGIRPVFVGEPARELLKLHPAADLHLFIALNDPKKFAAAHVLLTRAYHWTSSDSTWNGLFVDMDRDGNVILHSNQIPELRNYWAKRLQLQTILLPTWPLLVIAGIIPARSVYLLVRRALRRRLRRCVRCGYDTRGCKDRCPECGSEIVFDTVPSGVQK